MFSRTFLSVSCRTLAKSNFTVQKITCHRSLHLACRNLRRDLVIRARQGQHYRTPIVTATFIRYKSDDVAASDTAAAASGASTDASSATAQSNVVQSTAEASPTEDLISQIPEPPTPLPEEAIEAVTETLTHLQKLGLGSNWPPGLVQQALDYLHASVGLPWWASIALVTLCIRTIMFPLVIKIQKSTATMHNIQPQIQFLQEQLADARKMGDRMEVARLTHEMYTFMSQKGVNPLKNAALPMIQAPIFMSFFFGLRGMVQAPVDSMKEGGLWWFTDLTVPDPYYLLPIFTSCTLFVTMELGVDTVRAQSLGFMRHIMRAVPVIMFPFIMNFQGAILCYWVSTNLFSLVQVSILRIPALRTYFKIPELVTHDKKKLVATNKNFMEGFKDSWTNIKVARELNSREMYDEIVFEKAGKGPVPKTYKFDPTQQHPLTKAILAKKKD